MLISVFTNGGGLSPADLLQISALAADYGVESIEIGSRQELLLTVAKPRWGEDLARRIEALGMPTSLSAPQGQNIVSSLPATDIVDDTNWLTTGVYLDILAQFVAQPQLKVNIVDPAQALVPLFTGNINFIAAPEPHCWYVFLRPSGSVRRYAWPILVESESLGEFARIVEQIYTDFTANPVTDRRGLTTDHFYRSVMMAFRGRTRKVDRELTLPEAKMPLYEGLHQTRNGNFWLGLFRKSYNWPLVFVDALCQHCLTNRVGKLYLTPHKTLLIKDVRAVDVPGWNRLLGRHGIRTNLPAWHLNWQLPNADERSVNLRNVVLRQLEDTDVCTDALSFAVNVPFSEAVTAVVIHQNGAPDRFDVYQRTYQTTTNSQYVMVAKSQPLAQLGERIRQLALACYERLSSVATELIPDLNEGTPEKPTRLIHACPNCLSQYDDRYGEPHRGIAAGTPFLALSDTYTCGLCETGKQAFLEKWVE